jgi:hypothetical protein
MSSDNNKLNCWPTAKGRDSGLTRIYIFCILSGSFTNFKISFLHYDGFRLNRFFVIRAESCWYMLHIFVLIICCNITLHLISCYVIPYPWRINTAVIKVTCVAPFWRSQKFFPQIFIFARREQQISPNCAM